MPWPTGKQSERQQVLKAHGERTYPIGLRGLAQPSLNFTHKTYRVTKAADTPLTLLVCPTTTRKPGGGIQVFKQAMISLLMRQYSNIIASLSEGCRNVSYVEGPVAGTGKECFL
jgi:hypothetical protein